MLNSKRNIIVVLLIVLIVVIAILSILSKNQKETQQKNGNSQDIVESVDVLPTLPSSVGQGIDTSSETVVNSRVSIAELQSDLPYSKKLAINGRDIEVYIPAMNTSTFNWVLQIYVTGIAYDEVDGSTQDIIEEKLFTTAYDEISSFLEDHQIQPSELIIVWGDRNHIQNKIEYWLSN